MTFFASVEKRELLEGALEELLKILNQIEKEDDMKIVYYKNKQYKEEKENRLI